MHIFNPGLRKLFLLGFWSLAAFSSAFAQCPPDLWFDSQAEVDAFPATYPGCKFLSGPMLVTGVGITNLDSLRQLKTIGGKLQIEAPAVADISGLRGLTRVDGFLRIAGTALTNLHGLENLKSTGSNFTVENNTLLTTTTHFDSLENSGFSISGSPLLQDFGTFPSLKTGKTIGLKNPVPLTTLEGVFPILETVENLFLYDMTSLSDLNGLDSLKTVKLFDIKNTAIGDLAGLENLQRVTFFFLKQNPNLLDLGGAAALDTVQVLDIIGNPGLQSLHGLENLKFISLMTVSENHGMTTLADSARFPNIVWNSLSVSKNRSLKNLRGLENITLTGKGIAITENDSLRTLEGLVNLRKPYNVNLSDNPMLLDLAGLRNLESLTTFSIDNNDALRDLSGLTSLRSAKQLTISDNLRLQNLHGLDTLAAFPGGVLYVLRNDSITSLEGIGSLLGCSNILVKDNPMLSGCSVLAFCNALAVLALPPVISNNAPGCNSPAEVLAACNFSFNSLSGRVYLDPECDATVGSQDYFLPYQMIRQTDGRPLAYTDINGRYQVFLPENHDFAFRADAITGFSVKPDSLQVLTTGTPTIFQGRDFFLCPDSVFRDMQVSIAPIGAPRPGFENRYVIQYQNRSSQKEDAVLTLEFLDDLHDDFLSITNTSFGMVTGTNKLTWSLPNLPIFGTTGKIEVVVKLDAAAPLGAVLLPKVRIVPAQNAWDADWSNNEMTLPQTIVGSYDPNDKTVDKPEINLTTDPGEEHLLTYLVRFQNTGTAAAETVELRDTLPAELDFSTFEPLAASHRYTLSFPSEGMLNWRFDNINLPDSASNEPKSHGFVLFRIRTKPPIGVESVVENRVGIYFDFNPVVLTNFAKTIFYVPVSTVSPVSGAVLKIYPNPVSKGEVLKIELDEAFSGALKIEFLSLDGRVLQTFFRASNVAEVLNLADVNGAFFVRVSDGERSATRLVFVQ
jgi:uncharacterized repeat protein (TIGR01451 family)